MRCEEARLAIADARYAGGPAPELQAHLAQCAQCRALLGREDALDRWLALEPPAAAGPEFDARFFARLAQEKRGTSRGRVLRAGWLLAPLAAAAAAVLWLRTPAPQPAESAQGELSADELELAMDLELVQDLPVVAQLDELEAYELLNEVEPDELEQILAEER
jgi:hypothetical protein